MLVKVRHCAVFLLLLGGAWSTLAHSGDEQCPSSNQLLVGVVLQCGEDKVVGTLIANTRPNCEEDGATDCVTTETLTALSPEDIPPAFVKVGVQIGGVTGTYQNEIDADAIEACIADGQTECAVTATFSALVTTGLEEKVLAGEIVASISGIAVLGNTAHCTSDRQLNCLAVPAYPAVQGVRLDKCLTELPP